MKNEEMARLFSEATPYIQKYHGKTMVVKYGGNAMINEELKNAVMNDLVTLTLLGVLVVLTWQVMAITGVSVLLFGLLITLFCSWLSVNKFLRMKAGDLYKI